MPLHSLVCSTRLHVLVLMFSRNLCIRLAIFATPFRRSTIFALIVANPYVIMHPLTVLKSVTACPCVIPDLAIVVDLVGDLELGAFILLFTPVVSSDSCVIFDISVFPNVFDPFLAPGLPNGLGKVRVFVIVVVERSVCAEEQSVRVAVFVAVFVG